MRIMKLTIVLLVSALLCGIAPQAGAQSIIIDSATADLIKAHLDRALDGLSRGNILKAQNHIGKALALLPSSVSAPVGWFKIVTPFQWNQSDGPMPVQVNAMIDDGTSQPLYTGSVIIGMMGTGRVLELYDSNMQLLPNFQTTPFPGGYWRGYVTLRTASGSTDLIGLHATDPVTGVAGNSTPIYWIVP